MGVAQSYWNQAYQDRSFLFRWDYDFASPELIDTLVTLPFKKGDRALDLGCGGGRDAIYLAQSGFEVSAIDLSLAAIEVATQRASEAVVFVSWHVGDVLALPFADMSFDLVTDRACFHHIPTVARPKYASEVARVLKPGGVLFLRGASYSRDDSYYEVTQETVSAAFSESGFDIGQVHPIRLANNAGGLTANRVTLRRK